MFMHKHMYVCVYAQARVYMFVQGTCVYVCAQAHVYGVMK